MSLLKKWWFWVVSAVFLIIIILTATNPNGNVTQENSDGTKRQTVTGTTSAAETKPTVTATDKNALTTTSAAITSETTFEPSVVSSYREGTYKVGTDMPPGEYKVFSGSKDLDAYIEVAKDSTASIESIIANALFRTFLYITVEEGQYLKMRNCSAVPSEEAPVYTPVNGEYREGMYKVGIDIPAGEYKVNVDENASLDVGYIEVSRDSTLTLNSIIANEIFENSTYITVEEGQYLSMRDAVIKEEK
jgi:flagellar hook assembly protein FlgD